MGRRTFSKLLGAGMLCPALSDGAEAAAVRAGDSPARPKPSSPVDVGQQTELSVDQMLIRESRRVAFSLHPAEKHPMNPLVKANRSWEGWNAEMFGTVLYDEQENASLKWDERFGTAQANALSLP
jgi:hypothetical protein